MADDAKTSPATQEEDPYAKFYVDHSTGRPLDLKPGSADWEVFGRQVDAAVERSTQEFGRTMKRKYPQYLGEGRMEDVMAQCHTPQQKATLILRQAGKDLTHEWYSYPEFQAFVSELRRVADTSKETKPEPIPNDVYKDVITLGRIDI